LINHTIQQHHTVIVITIFLQNFDSISSKQVQFTRHTIAFSVTYRPIHRWELGRKNATISKHSSFCFSSIAYTMIRCFV